MSDLRWKLKDGLLHQWLRQILNLRPSFPNLKSHPVRPDKETIEQFRGVDDIIGRNIENVVKDYEETVSANYAGDNLPRGQKQALVNITFTAFVTGLVAAMNPKSNFNSKYRTTSAPEAQV